MRHLRFAVIALAVVLVAVGTGRARVSAQPADGSPVVATFRGSPDASGLPYLGPVTLHAGLAVVRARHNGTGNFSVWLRLPEPGAAPNDDTHSLRSYLLINTAGRFDGSAATVVSNDGDYYISGSANGAYEITVEQPTPTTVHPVDPGTLNGANVQVSPALALRAGTYTISTHFTATVMRVYMYVIDDLGGGPFGTGYYGKILDSSSDGPSVTIDVPQGGLYLLMIEPGGTGSERPWTLSIE